MYGVYIRYISYVESKYTVSANPINSNFCECENFLKLTPMLTKNATGVFSSELGN